jgi:adenine-specific DNA-methyltransferase
MSTNYEKLKKALAEIFQLDQADLDFGIYRIMNQKRGEITRFLEKDLLPQVKQAFAAFKPADKSEIKSKLDTLVQQITDAGLNPDESPKVQELKAQYNTATDFSALENEVFSHLTNFFRRYYDKGDFISQRRYKEGVYAIPYEGEEVKLYWANHDQYYVKTSEYFRDYTFKLPSNRTVHFKIAEADTEKDNIKSANGNDRRFILCDKEPIEKTDTELIIKFEYKSDEAKRSQKDLNATALDIIMSWEEISDWTKELSMLQPTEANPRRILLEKHLNDYTARNTFDYFIHKDLGKFLRRELDFFIKNEIMHLDDIENESAPRIEQYVSMIKVIRLIAHKIIAFLAQIEDFQKKLWLKKKFVVETNYCITIDRVPEELYPEIAANESQREEWVKLFAIDEITGDLAKNAYAVPLNVQFLKENPFLVVDTKFFSEDFKAKLLASFDNLDEQINGLLIQSENYQGVNLLHKRFRGQTNCVYADPPFNTSASEILYKNNYKHSSWLSMISDRTQACKPLMSHDAILCMAIDDYELSRLLDCLLSVFGEDGWLATVAVRSNPHGRAMAAGFSPNHEYAVFYGNTEHAKVGRLPRDAKKQGRYPETDEYGSFAWMNFRKTGAGSSRTERPKLFYPIYVSTQGAIRFPPMKWANELSMWEPEETPREDERLILPVDEEKRERVWNMGWHRAQREATANLCAKKTNDEWQVYRKYRPNEEGALPGTWWDNAKYSATESGTRTVKDILGDREIFSYPKSIYLVVDCLRATNCYQHSLVLDIFAGSGTTGHAVINLNREDGGNRKYILVEMGEHFDTVMKPRIQKVVYSKDWKDGKPVSREGSSHIFKYLRLESYEDTLNNLELARTKTQETLLTASKSFKESYMLSYILDVESKDSLLNLSVFEDPFNYKLKIATGSVGETRPVNVDLVETFNYLIGLTVHHIDYIQGYRVVQGINPKGEKVLVIWRNVKEKSNENLEQFFRKQDYNPKDMEFAIIYVNGDNNLENIRREDETWKVRLIEEEFQRLMFSTEEV